MRTVFVAAEFASRPWHGRLRAESHPAPIPTKIASPLARSEIVRFFIGLSSCPGSLEFLPCRFFEATSKDTNPAERSPSAFRVRLKRNRSQSARELPPGSESPCCELLGFFSEFVFRNRNDLHQTALKSNLQSLVPVYGNYDTLCPARFRVNMVAALDSSECPSLRLGEFRQSQS